MGEQKSTFKSKIPNGYGENADVDLGPNTQNPMPWHWNSCNTDAAVQHACHATMVVYHLCLSYLSMLIAAIAHAKVLLFKIIKTSSPTSVV